jgi:hypothetical protein
MGSLAEEFNMSELTQKILGGLVRTALAGVTGWLINKGIINSGDVATLISGITVGLITVAWTVYQKYGSHLQLLTALASPAGTTVAQVKAAVASGAAPVAVTPDTSVPVKSIVK